MAYRSTDSCESPVRRVASQAREHQNRTRLGESPTQATRTLRWVTKVYEIRTQLVERPLATIAACQQLGSSLTLPPSKNFLSD